jgi:hypothetical protein
VDLVMGFLLSLGFSSYLIWKTPFKGILEPAGEYAAAALTSCCAD